MFHTTTFAGIQMKTQRNRRALVVLTYVLIGVVSVLLGVTRGMKFASPFWIILVFSGVSRWIFGSLVPQESFPVPNEKPVDLGLAASGPRPEPQPDEREVAMRDRAYFKAFRVVAGYSVFVFALVAMVQDPTFLPGLNILQVFAAVLVVLVLTLPQAILLWQHPDLLEENG
jgi:hypothetical protein